MTTEDFITDLFCRIDDVMKDVPKHPQSLLFPSEIITLGVLFALKGGGSRAFYRWLERYYLPLFPKLPERTRLFRLFAAHWDWTLYFLVEPGLLSIIDSYGIELIHPVREGRSEEQIGKKGLSNRRWIVGGKLCWLFNHLGLVIGWDFATANVHDNYFRPFIEHFEDRTVIFSDMGFHSKEGDPSNLKVCKPYTHNERMLIETALSLLTTIYHFKKSFIVLGSNFRLVWLSRWLLSTCSFRGMASRLMQTAYFTYPSPNSVCDLSLAPLVIYLRRNCTGNITDYWGGLYPSSRIYLQSKPVLWIS